MGLLFYFLNILYNAAFNLTKVATKIVCFVTLKFDYLEINLVHVINHFKV